ncbi:MAG TPA: extracellular solute-binding protein, partial [Chloroflexota bacterium]|nr:extracellular solute-binding protein [Chloroflexota bacterium]
KIVLEYLPIPGDYVQVIRTNQAAGTLADAIYFESGTYEASAGGGMLAALEPFVQRDRLDLKQWYASAIEAMKVEGKLYGLPSRGQLARCFLFYNRDLFAQAGVPELTEQSTLDQLAAAAEKLTVRDGSRFGYAVNWGAFQDTVATLRRWGADLLSADGKKCVADSAEAVAAMQWHHDLWHRRQVLSPKVWAVPDFASGAVAIGGGLLAGNRSAVHGAVQSNFKWNMLPMPRGPGAKFGAILTVAPIGMNRQSKAQDQTWQTLKWFTDRETGVLLGLQSTGSATPGMRKDVYCDGRLLSDPNFTREMQERVCRIMDQAAGVPYTVPWNYKQPEVDAVVRRHMDAFRTNTAAPNPQTMRALTAEVQAVLDLPR